MPNLILLSLLAAFPPLSIDMYLPAIPVLQDAWVVPFAEINRSLVIFIITFSACLLIHGPLSDRFGRRPVLIGGILLFIFGSGLCAFADSIAMLLTARAVQGAGAAAASSLSLALTKDLYEGVARQKLLGYIGVIMALCPMIAPTLGGFVMEIGSWRWIFGIQACVALVGLYGVYRLEEPVTELTRGGVVAVAGRYLVVLKNGRFLSLALAFAVMTLPHFGFIGGSSDIYINGFDMPNHLFGLYFGVNALGFMTGSFTCTRLSGVLKPVRNLYISLGLVLMAGALLLALGGTSPLTVALPMVCVTFAVGFSRPVSNSMILDQVDSDVGAASGIMTFLFFFIGAMSMEVISLEWPNKPAVLGLLALVGAVFPLTALLAMRRRGQF